MSIGFMSPVDLKKGRVALSVEFNGQRPLTGQFVRETVICLSLQTEITVDVSGGLAHPILLGTNAIWCHFKT